MTGQTETTAVLPIASVGEAEQMIANLDRIMDSLLVTVEEETALVRAGRLRAASEIEPAKTELAGRYAVTSERIKANREFLSHNLPEAIAALRRRHDTFHALLQINLTVLATAHAVSEGIIRGVSDELARKRSPQTYGASGRANAPARSAAQPLAVSRTS